MTPQDLSTAAGILLSLAFSYLPGVRDRYELLDGAAKRLVMLLALVCATLGAFALACWLPPLAPIAIACDQAGALSLARALVQAVIANQATYLVAPRRQR